ncbi:GNAT family N-acetyltransferase [Streptomyces sp. DG2A-72]|uniref:GNAT family N-acetyltransferase n=1 Tax=Streptomyces sp. DG2A-72 TaxID=3051386 RepID=UPI00265BD1CC|nr:GNAT family N-acetyltransferase [Streptomyces sp. DG2A-72]MDO0933914.1 GNAT family N-acetyltransferase [Streptomyces sp. DG2A-72]
MTTHTEFDLRHYGHADASAIRGLLLDVHDEVYEGSDDPLAGREEFAKFVDHWSAREVFACVVGYDRGEPIGYAYGAPLSAATTWWAKVIPPLPGEFTAESGARTFALSELMVRTSWRGTGAAKAIHDELLRGRAEERVTLLVHRQHRKVRALYESWGYREVGETVPFDGAPELCAMVLRLGA